MIFPIIAPSIKWYLLACLYSSYVLVIMQLWRMIYGFKKVLMHVNFLSPKLIFITPGIIFHNTQQASLIHHTHNGIEGIVN